jgi:tetratricopeptide (TPR) repeat protein
MGEPEGLGPAADSSRILESWKEIAAYLNRTVRTAQRWEQTEGLPVHRHSHEKRDSVYAYPHELDGWWGKRKTKLEGENGAAADTGPAETLAAPRVTRRFRFLSWLAAAAAIAVFAGAAGMWYFFSGRASALGFARQDWVLITDFDNQTGDPLFDRSLLLAFTAGFQQSTHANVIPRVQIEAALRRMGKSASLKIDEQVGREICLRESVRGMISCGIAGAGQQYVVVARLVDPHSGEAVRSYAEDARGQGEVLTGLGRIASRIRRDLGESLVSIRRSDRPLPQVTTPSLEALREYAQGSDFWRKGQHQEAVALFESALKRDPDFAMAHAGLGNAYLSHIYSQPAQGKAHYDKALEHSDRLTDRERLYIQATREGSLGHSEEAVRRYRLYLSAYPDDWSAHHSLGTLLMRQNQLAEAARELREAVRLAPNYANSRINLATTFKQSGESKEALDAYAKAFELEPAWITSENLNHEYGFTYVMAGKSDKAREVFALLTATPDKRASGLRSLALLDLWEGRYREARGHLREAILLTEGTPLLLKNARDHLFLSIVVEGQGDLAAQLGELDRARKALESVGDWPAWLGAEIAIAYARAGALGKAEGLLAEIRKKTDRSSPGELSELYRSEGEVALAGGNVGGSLEFLQRADLSLSGPLTVESLAHGYERSGDAERSIRDYEKLIAMRGRALGWEAQQAWIAAHVQMAEYYQARGEKAKGLQALSPVLEIWKQADGDLPMTRNIRRLQSALQ